VLGVDDRLGGVTSVSSCRLSADSLTKRLESLDLPFVSTYQGRVLEALGDATRRSIFELLAAGPRSVAEIAANLPVSRPAVSQHLKVLKAAELVSSTAVGTRRLYTLDPRGLAAIHSYFDQFWNQALAAFAHAAENPPEEKK
jgi:DNA-binding transcriptional ArsR family regulator